MAESTPATTPTQTPASQSPTSGTLEPKATVAELKPIPEPQSPEGALETEGVKTLLDDAAKPEGEAKQPQGPEFAAYDEGKLNLKIPEGQKADPVVMGQLKDIAGKYSVPQGAMQALVDLARGEIEKVANAGQTAWNELNQQWVEQVKADKEIGGPEGLRSDVKEMIGRVFADPALADPDIKRALSATGAGNNPAIIRTFARMAKVITEGGHVAGAPPVQPTPKSLAQRMYPDLPSSGGAT